MCLKKIKILKAFKILKITLYYNKTTTVKNIHNKWKVINHWEGRILSHKSLIGHTPVNKIIIHTHILTSE